MPSAPSPETRQRVIEELARRAGGNYDSHPDPDVGHVQLPGSREGFHGPETIDARGMRERTYALPKPPGTVRVVVLGDSFVFGWRVRAEERLGVFLEQDLRAHGAATEHLEVLHLGVISWSLVSECAWVLRQVEALAPDLVVQVTVTNDLDDPQGVRGFGTLASVATGPRGALVSVNHPRDVLGVERQGYLGHGLGAESRARFDEARRWIERLRAELARLPGAPRHLLLVNWNQLNPNFHEHLGRFLEPDSVLYLPVEFWKQPEYRVAPDDVHWSPAGHAAVARLLTALVRERGLLPLPGLAPWPEAEAEAHALFAAGRAAAEGAPVRPAGLRSTLDLRALGEREACQVFGGIDRDGLTAPGATVLLEMPAGARALVLRGRFLPEHALEGLEVRVQLEERELGRLRVRAGEPFEERLALFPGAETRGAVSVRFLADDFVYRGDDLRQCVTLALEQVGLE